MSVTRRGRALYAEPVEGVIVPEFRTVADCRPRNVGEPKELQATSYQFWNWGGRGVRKEEAATDANTVELRGARRGRFPGSCVAYCDMKPV
jgi:hypothetical protein